VLPILDQTGTTMFNAEEAGNLFTIAVVYGGMVVAALWLAMVIWTYRDMRARSRDGLAQLLVAVMVAVLTLPGLFIYLMLRPRETLSEAYERSLEEEALLQEIEEKPACPGCSQRVEVDWQVCPQCHTRLKKPCVHCGKKLELSWSLCPHCATVQAPQQDNFDYSGYALPDAPPTSEPRVTVTRRDPAVRGDMQAGPVEFVDTDDY
jgi:hypothetical protein